MQNRAASEHAGWCRVVNLSTCCPPRPARASNIDLLVSTCTVQVHMPPWPRPCKPSFFSSFLRLSLVPRGSSLEADSPTTK